MRRLVTISSILVLVLTGQLGCYQAQPKSPEPTEIPPNQLTTGQLEYFTSTPIKTFFNYEVTNLYDLKAKPVEMKTEKLLPEAFIHTDKVKIVKWTGDDLIFLLPAITENASGAVSNVITVIGEKGVIAQYKTELTAYDVNLLEDKILFSSKGGRVNEIDYSGNYLWGLGIDQQSSHQVALTKDGTYLIARMNYDQVVEMSRDGEIIWQWNALEGLPNYNAENFEGWELIPNENMTRANTMHREYMTDRQGVEWTHINHIQKLDDGYIISLRNQDLVIKVNKAGKIVWSFGPGIIKHQHCPNVLANGNLLVYDNGNGRVAEFTPAGELVWEYTGLLGPVWGWIEKIWNGNYVFPDAYGGRILEVDSKGNVVKEVWIEGMRFYQAKAYPVGYEAKVK